MNEERIALSGRSEEYFIDGVGYHEGIETGKLQAKKEFLEWLLDLIDTSKICLLDKKPSEEYDKLMFQLESKSKKLKKEVEEKNEN